MSLCRACRGLLQTNIHFFVEALNLESNLLTLFSASIGSVVTDLKENSWVLSQSAIQICYREGFNHFVYEVCVAQRSIQRSEGFLFRALDLNCVLARGLAG